MDFSPEYSTSPDLIEVRKLQELVKRLQIQNEQLRNKCRLQRSEDGNFFSTKSGGSSFVNHSLFSNVDNSNCSTLNEEKTQAANVISCEKKYSDLNVYSEKDDVIGEAYLSQEKESDTKNYVLKDGLSLDKSDLIDVDKMDLSDEESWLYISPQNSNNNASKLKPSYQWLQDGSQSSNSSRCKQIYQSIPYSPSRIKQPPVILPKFQKLRERTFCKLPSRTLEPNSTFIVDNSCPLDEKSVDEENDSRLACALNEEKTTALKRQLTQVISSNLQSERKRQPSPSSRIPQPFIKPVTPRNTYLPKSMASETNTEVPCSQNQPFKDNLESEKKPSIKGESDSEYYTPPPSPNISPQQSAAKTLPLSKTFVTSSSVAKKVLGGDASKILPSKLLRTTTPFVSKPPQQSQYQEQQQTTQQQRRNSSSLPGRYSQGLRKPMFNTKPLLKIPNDSIPNPPLTKDQEESSPSCPTIRSSATTARTSPRALSPSAIPRAAFPSRKTVR